MRRRLRHLLSRWWPLPAAAVVLGLQQYGWARAVDDAVAIWRAAWPVFSWAWPPLVAGLLIVWIHRPGVAATVAWLRRLPRAVPIGLLVAGALGLLGVVFVALPPWFVPDNASVQDLYKARNDVRATAVQAAAGIAVLLGAYFTWRQVLHNREQLEATREQLVTVREQLEVARQGQVTERFTRAIDQLGSAQLDVRLGGIYALERIAQDSDTDQWTIAEVLTAYVRTHSPWPPTQPGQGRAQLTPDQVRDLPDVRARMPDVQAALTVLGRGRFASFTAMGPVGRDLGAADLRRANFASAHLEGVWFPGAHLEGAYLGYAHLKGAIFIGAHLEGAEFDSALLEGANFSGAHLEGAHFASAHLEAAILWRAHLEGADFESAHLMGAWLGYADLRGTNLRRARLERAFLYGADLAGADLTHADVARAQATDATRWPDGFEWRAAGVILVDQQGQPVEGQPVTEDDLAGGGHVRPLP